MHGVQSRGSCLFLGCFVCAVLWAGSIDVVSLLIWSLVVLIIWLLASEDHNMTALLTEGSYIVQVHDKKQTMPHAMAEPWLRCCSKSLLILTRLAGPCPQGIKVCAKLQCKARYSLMMQIRHCYL